ncbi:MAG: hypothetical protein KA715_00065 [Xanthomonadaceae bacterium]|nr:hypothetical protein [Xanthomonadaceae bacterium]
MGKVISTTHFLNESPIRKEDRSLLIDTNVLFAYVYEPHVFNEAATLILEGAVKSGLSIYCGMSVRTEFLELQRKTILTEQLLSMLSSKTKWKISHALRAEIQKHKIWLDQQPAKNELPILTDGRLKQIKKTFTPSGHSGQIGWMKFCNEYLSDLYSSWKTHSEKLGLNYLGARESEQEKDLFNKPLKWSEAYELISKTGLSSNDALILNLFLSSKISHLATFDFDMAYGFLAEKNNSQFVVVPDSIYNRDVKTLQHSFDF